MKFCCARFESYHQDSGKIDAGSFKRETYPNIKIVKLSPNDHNQGKNLYRYLLVCGFMEQAPPSFVNMKYCPFCGTDLFKFYRSDEYVNNERVDFFG
jgi:hypothetical protein